MIYLGPNNPNGQATRANSTPVVIASDQTALPVNSADVTSSGSVTALAGNVVLALSGQSAGTIQITGTWVGALQFEGSLDGTTWNVINATAASTSTPSTTTVVNGLFRITPGGLQQFRIVSTAWTSGTATILMRAALGTAGIYVNQIAPVKLYDGTNLASIFPATFLRTTDEPRQVFYDNFDSAPDTVNVWNSTQGSGGVAAAVVNGILSLGAGTLANGFSKILSIPSFKLPIPGWLGFSDAIALSDGAAPTANVARYWGTFSSPAAPTTSAPITDGYVFEESTTGKLSAVVYAAGVRTLIADLSSSGTNVQPLDALYHRYLIYVRTDKTYYYIDGVGPSNLVATTNFQSPAIQTLGTGLLVVNGPTPPVSNIQIQCAGLAVWDTGKNATQVADGTFPWRKATISAAGAMSVNNGLIQGLTDTQLRASALPVSGAFFQTTQPVSLATNTPVIAAGSSIIGKVGIDQTTDGTTNAIRLLAETTKVIGTVNVAGTVPVSGTFFQATQPVSLATNTPDITDRAARLLGVVASITNALPTGANTIGAVTNTNLDVALSTRLKPADTLAGVTTVAAVTAITNALPAGTNIIGKTSIDQTTDGTTNLVRLGAETTKVIGTVNLASPAITYSAVASSIAPAALATDFFTIYGSATKTVNITNIWVTGVQTTAGQAQFMLIKRSTVNTGGTSTAPTRVPNDSNDAAATATVLAYTANPTAVGTAIGNVRGDRIFLPGAASASDAQGLLWSFVNAKPMILRGVAQGICVNLNGATITGGSINVTIEWTET